MSNPYSDFFLASQTKTFDFRLQELEEVGRSPPIPMDPGIVLLLRR